MHMHAGHCVDVAYDFPTWSRLDQREEVVVEDIVTVEVQMALVHGPDIASYFQDSLRFTRKPGFRELFIHHRCCSNDSKVLHCNGNCFSVPKGQDGYDSLYSVRPILDLTTYVLMKILSPGKDLSFDKLMVKFKGRQKVVERN